jgi:hypothetical protein
MDQLLAGAFVLGVALLRVEIDMAVEKRRLPLLIAGWIDDALGDGTWITKATFSAVSERMPTVERRT